MRKGIVLAGTVVLDVVNLIDNWPAEEQISFIRNVIPAPGGPPHNAAAGLLKLQAPFPVTLVGCVGDDAYGNIFLNKASEHGLDLSRMIVSQGLNTDYTHVMTSLATGRRTFFFQSGANNRLSPQDLKAPHDEGRIFYLGSPGLSSSMDQSDGWRKVLSDAQARGYKTCLELCPVPADLQRQQVRPCLPLLDYFVINDSEAEIVSGLPVLKDGDFDKEMAFAAASALLNGGVREIVAIHHPMGAVAVQRDGKKVFAASVNVPANEIAGSVGAGDAFHAGMLLGLHEGWTLEQCLALANASAATSLHAPTTSASIRPWTECLAYASEKGLR